MFYFIMAPSHFRKLLTVLDHRRDGESIASHYLRRFGHLVAPDVDLWEISSDGNTGRLVRRGPAEAAE